MTVQQSISNSPGLLASQLPPFPPRNDVADGCAWQVGASDGSRVGCSAFQRKWCFGSKPKVLVVFKTFFGVCFLV